MTQAYIKTLKDKDGNIIYPQTSLNAVTGAHDLSLADLNEDENHRTVTDIEKATWSGKANASDIPTNVSELTNDSGFITASEVPSAVFVVTFTQVDGEWTTETTADEFNSAYDSGKSILIQLGFPEMQYFFTITLKSPSVVIGYMFMEGSIVSTMWNLSTGAAQMYTQCIPYEPVISASTLLASMWSDGEYSFERNYPINEYNIEVELNGDAATEEQIEAWSRAKMIGSANGNKLYAKGDVPTINLPIILKRVAK